MITKAQALELNYRGEVHYIGQHDCKRTVGPRGGVRVAVTVARVNGQCKTWKRSPERFYLPVVHGLRDYGSISEGNGQYWHLASECPLDASEA